MQANEILFAVVLGYAAFVALAEGLIGMLQPNMDEGITLTTTDSKGRRSERKLACLKLDGKLYIGSNHWLRGWYRQALAEPDVLAEVDGVQAAYSAVSIQGEERARISDVYRMGFVLRFLCGFAPSKFLRLDPIQDASPAVPQAGRK